MVTGLVSRNGHLHNTPITLNKQPSYWHFFPRPKYQDELFTHLVEGNLIEVNGAMGCGKTFLVSHAINNPTIDFLPKQTLWYTTEPGASNIQGFLFQMGLHLLGIDRRNKLFSEIQNIEKTEQHQILFKTGIKLFREYEQVDKKVVIVIDNLDQCDDPHFVKFINRIARRSSSFGKLILICRSPFCTSRKVRRMRMDGFSMKEVEAFINEYYHDLPFSPQDIEYLNSKTSGNPLLLQLIFQFSADRINHLFTSEIAIEELEYHPALRDLFYGILSSLTPNEKKLLARIIKIYKPLGISHRLIGNLLYWKKRSMSEIDSLVNKGVLYDKDSSYSFIPITLEYFKMAFSFE